MEDKGPKNKNDKHKKTKRFWRGEREIFGVGTKELNVKGCFFLDIIWMFCRFNSF